MSSTATEVGTKRRRSKPRRQSMWRSLRTSLLIGLLAKQKKWVWLSAFLFMVTALTTLQVTNVTVAMVDDAIVAQAVPLEPFIGKVIMLAVVAFVAGFIQTLVTKRLSYQLEYDLRTWLYRSVHSAELQRLDGVASGQLITRSLTDLNFIERFLAYAPTLIGILPVFIGVGLYMLLLNPFVAVVSLGGLPLDIWLLRRFRVRLWGLSWAELNERAEVTAAIDEPVRGIRVVKAFGREEHERNRVAAVTLRTYRFAMTRWRLLARYDVLLKAMPILLQAVLLGVGARIVSGGNLTLGSFMLAFQISSYTVLVGGMVDEVASMFQYLRSAQNRLGELLGLGNDEQPARTPSPADATLDLRQVGVTLAGRQVLDRFDLSVRPGQLVVVTGAPSSGKTTVAAVACGVLPTDEGSVLLGGVPMRDLDPAVQRRTVRVASEESFLFATTVRENLELAVEGAASDDAIWKALRTAAADDFVADLPGGLDGEVGDRGLTLSGGQRQRLSLARALVDPPRILVLDDALSAVNPSLEVEILRSIRREYPNVGIICTNRRTGAATIADRVIALPDPVTDPVVVTTDVPIMAEALDPALTQVADVIASLKLSDELPGSSEADVTLESRPRPREILRPFKAVLAGTLFVLAVHSLVKFAPEIMLGSVADNIKHGDHTTTDVLALVLAVLGLVYAGASYFVRVLSQRFTQGIMYLLRRRVFHRLSKLGVDFYDREMPGEVATRVVHDLDVIQMFLYMSTQMIFLSTAQLVVGLSVILFISPVVFPVVLAMVGVLVVLMIVQYPIGTRVFNRARDALGAVTSAFEEDFSARQLIRGYDAVDRQSRKFVERSLTLREARKRVALVNAVFGELMQFTSHVAAALVLYRSGNLVLAGAISVGSAISLRLLATTATQPLPALARVYTEYLDVKVSWNRLREPFDVPILPVEAPDAVGCPDLVGEITFDGVAFKYPHTERTVLHDVSFMIPAGTVASMVGYTGAGKSSMAKLLMRTYDPDAGAVRVDGLDLRALELDTFRPQIGVVPQDAFVFRGTVASNIAYGRPDATAEEIEEAARAVGAHSVLTALSDGYDHPVEEEGRNLTSAQRQLIALARAWIAGPRLLVLDEATSCLDAQLEQEVLEAVARLGCTTLMVTHRDNVVAVSDLVIVLDAGRVAEIGSPAALRGAGGAYDRLWVAVPEDADALAVVE